MLCTLIHELCNIHIHFSTSALPTRKGITKCYGFFFFSKISQQSQITIPNNTNSFLKKILFIHFLERWREEERKRNINVWLPLTCAPTGDLAHNLGMCFDGESNWRPFDSQASTQSTEPQQLGPNNTNSLMNNTKMLR